ncbi:MAG: hypothetical protein U0T02_05575 [Solirubrobacteraceae bacterium]
MTQVDRETGSGFGSVAHMGGLSPIVRRIESPGTRQRWVTVRPSGSVVTCSR